MTFYLLSLIPILAFIDASHLSLSAHFDNSHPYTVAIGPVTFSSIRRSLKGLSWKENEGKSLFLPRCPGRELPFPSCFWVFLLNVCTSTPPWTAGEADPETPLASGKVERQLWVPGKSAPKQAALSPGLSWKDENWVACICWEASPGCQNCWLGGEILLSRESRIIGKGRQV